MARSAYSNSSAPIRTDRGTEYEVFAKITRQLKAAANAPSNFPALVRALHDNRALWIILATDVADDDNALPANLRAQILYLSEFTTQHSRKVLNKEASVDTLIDINTAIMRGLRNKAGTA